MRKDITIVAEPRAERGKNAARRLRVRGRVPAIVYGAGQEATAVGGCWPLRTTDYISSTHRGHGHCLAKGMDMTPMSTKKITLEELPENVIKLQTDRSECKVTYMAK